MSINGASHAFLRISLAILVFLSAKSGTPFAILISSTPHPIVTHSATAAFVAAIASSILYFLFLSSITVAAPTLIIATPPTNLANLFSYICFSNDSVSSIILRTTLTLSSISSLLHIPSTIVVDVLSEVTFFAFPRCFTVTISNFNPASSVITVAQVIAAISKRIAFFSRPTPGALIGSTFTNHLILLRINDARHSHSISSAMMTSGEPSDITTSRIFTISFIFVNFLSVTSIYGSFITHSFLSVSVTKYGLTNHWSNCIHVFISLESPGFIPSSTVMIPSGQTASKHSAMIFPTSSSCAERLATCLISSNDDICLAPALSESSMKRFTSCKSSASLNGFIPLETYLIPSLQIACASTVVVLVPSPTSVFVFSAASITIAAHIFSIGSSNETSFATLTPSFVTIGEFPPLATITFIPFGPIVEPTMFATFSTPANNLVLLC